MGHAKNKPNPEERKPYGQPSVQGLLRPWKPPSKGFKNKCNGEWACQRLKHLKARRQNKGTIMVNRKYTRKIYKGRGIRAMTRERRVVRETG